MANGPSTRLNRIDDFNKQLEILYENALKKKEDGKFEEERRKKILKKREERELEYRKWKSRQHQTAVDQAKAIFEWGTRIANDHRSSTIFGVQGGPMRVYTGQYLHCRRAGFGSYAELDLRKDGSFRYRERYKWMGYDPGEYFELDGPRMMARHLDPNYIKEVKQSIDSGKVWDAMARHLE